MNAWIDVHHGMTEPFAAGTGNPASVMIASKPSVLRHTVLPPALPPLMTSARSVGRKMRSTGCGPALLADLRIEREKRVTRAEPGITARLPRRG